MAIGLRQLNRGVTTPLEYGSFVFTAGHASTCRAWRRSGLFRLQNGPVLEAVQVEQIIRR